MKVQLKLVNHVDEGEHVEWGKYQFDFISDLIPYAPHQVGDILYVRERIDYRPEHRNYYYHADDKGVGHDIYRELYAHFYKPNNEPKKVIPSIHMPKFAARIFLEVTEVRCERVQDISKTDALHEGVKWKAIPTWTNQDYRERAVPHEQKIISLFKSLWDSLYPGSWERNDWVWVTTFKQVDKEQANAKTNTTQAD